MAWCWALILRAQTGQLTNSNSSEADNRVSRFGRNRRRLPTKRTMLSLPFNISFLFYKTKNNPPLYSHFTFLLFVFYSKPFFFSFSFFNAKILTKHENVSSSRPTVVSKLQLLLLLFNSHIFISILRFSNNSLSNQWYL